MFEYQPRRHPLQTFQFWFAMFLCSAVVIAWRMDFFSATEDSTVQNETIVEEELPPPPLHADLRQSERPAGAETNVVMAPAQTESSPESPADSPFARPAVNNAAPQQVEETSFNQVEAITPANNQVAQKPEIQQLSSQSRSATDSTSVIRTATLTTPETQTTSPLPQTNSQPLIARTQPVDMPKFDLGKIDEMISLGDDVSALRELSTIYWKHPEERARLRERINQTSRRIYFQPHPHYMPPYEVQFGERLETIAKKYSVSWEYLSKINRVQPQRLRAGQKLKVIQGPFSVVIDLSDFEATVHSHGYFVVRMPVGIGKDGATPIGKFRVTDKVVDPIYYGPDGVVANDDPTNPLGERWIAINDESETLQGYGIHGTIEPETIGKAESRGCVRLHDQDIADLYDLLTIGSEVIIRP